MTDLILHCRASSGTLTLTHEALDTQSCCSCCGIQGVSMSVSGLKFCTVCAPAYSVDEPDIDAVCALIWLPHIDQGFLSRLLRAAYAARYVSTDPTPLQLSMASSANNLLIELEKIRSSAKRMIGTDQISVLRSVAPKIPQFNLFLRLQRVSGLRILPLEPWFTLHGEAFTELLTFRE